MTSDRLLYVILLFVIFFVATAYPDETFEQNVPSGEQQVPIMLVNNTDILGCLDAITEWYPDGKHTVMLNISSGLYFYHKENVKITKGSELDAIRQIASAFGCKIKIDEMGTVTFEDIATSYRLGEMAQSPAWSLFDFMGSCESTMVISGEDRVEIAKNINLRILLSNSLSLTPIPFKGAIVDGPEEKLFIDVLYSNKKSHIMIRIYDSFWEVLDMDAASKQTMRLAIGDRFAVQEPTCTSLVIRYLQAVVSPPGLEFED